MVSSLFPSASGKFIGRIMYRRGASCAEALRLEKRPVPLHQVRVRVRQHPERIHLVGSLLQSLQVRLSTAQVLLKRRHGPLERRMGFGRRAIVIAVRSAPSQEEPCESKNKRGMTQPQHKSSRK